jgi:excisionase family DNA binding protein
VHSEIEMLRPADIAARLGVSPGRIYQLIAAGLIPAVRVGRALRIPRAAWEGWLRERSEEALASLGRAADKCVERGDRSAR